MSEVGFQQKLKAKAKTITVYRESNGNYWTEEGDLANLTQGLDRDSSIKLTLIASNIVLEAYAEDQKAHEKCVIEAFGNGFVEGRKDVQEKFESKEKARKQKLQTMIDTREDYLKSFRISPEEPQYSKLWGQIDLLKELLRDE